MARNHFALQTLALHCFRLGQTVSDCLESLNTSQGSAAPSKSTITRWFRSFRKGETTVGRKEGSGRLPSAVTAANIAAVSRIVDEDSRVTYQQIQHELGIGSVTTKIILKDKLGLRKICARWVPHGLTREQKNARRVFAQGMLDRYSKNTDVRLKEIVTGDETWVYYYDPLTKIQSMEWRGPNQPRPE